MTNPVSHHDLLDAFGEPGCPVCRVVLRAVERFIQGTNRDLVNTPDVWNEIMASLGFCNLHAQQWLATAHPLGTAYIYETLLERIGKEIEQQKPARGAGLRSRLGAGNASALMPEKRCLICIQRDEQEALLISTLLKGLGEASFRSAYQASSGLCFPHLRRALGSANAESFKLLRTHALNEQARLRDQLKEIIRKHDYRFRDEPIGEERDATERAVNLVAGAKGIADR